jgi:mono/diheme cytochrome c family protein
MRAAVLILTTLLVTTPGLLAGQREGWPAPPVVVPQFLTGAASFDLYCASCHGRAGTGDGPVASSLRSRPADLTQLSRRHDGVFPRADVRAYIDGRNRPPAAHGSSDMPVWGPIFHALDVSDPRAEVRLDNLVAFIESIQQPIAQAPAPALANAPDGAALFASYCASCHGRSGRGDGPMVATLRRAPADLTKFTMRNGGVFPQARVARIIDGRDVASHGDGEMPVWGNVFRREGADADGAAARIDALVRFLARIQERPAE